jgi:hypothetical protein
VLYELKLFRAPALGFGSNLDTAVALHDDSPSLTAVFVFEFDASTRQSSYRYGFFPGCAMSLLAGKPLGRLLANVS